VKCTSQFCLHMERSKINIIVKCTSQFCLHMETLIYQFSNGNIDLSILNCMHITILSAQGKI
jgi:hypothetical protein